jgi:hypothetical protein
VEGSYTVEAALIFPCIFFVIIGLMYLGFYMHDKVRIQAIIDETVIKGRALIRTETNIKTGLLDYEAYYERGIFYFINNDIQEKQNHVYDYIQNQLSRGFFIASVENINVTVTNSNISIKVNASMDFPYVDIERLFLESGLSVQLVNNSDIQNPVEFIRIFDVFSGVADRVEVVNGTLIKLQKILSKIR